MYAFRTLAGQQGVFLMGINISKFIHNEETKGIAIWAYE